MRIEEWTMKEIRLIKKEEIGNEMGRNDEECVSYGSRNSWMGGYFRERERRNEKVDREKWSILERLDRVILPLLSFCLRTEEYL